MRNKKIIRRRALRSINALFKEAERVFNESPERADRYAQIARRISLRCKVRIPRKWKRRYCKKCHKFLRPGVNARVRLRNKKIVITCLECNNRVRIPYYH
jgi:ribonuclease P protein subunit RPR2